MEMQTPPPPPKNSQNPGGKMSEMDIISKASAGKVDAKNLYASLSHAVETNPKLRIMRANNTLFVYFNKGDGSVDATMETADDPRKVVDSLKQFCQAMKKSNFKTIKFEIENPDIVRAIKMAGFEPKLSGVAGQQMTGMVEV